jgi:hypothetical protein
MWFPIFFNAKNENIVFIIDVNGQIPASAFSVNDPTGPILAASFQVRRPAIIGTIKPGQQHRFAPHLPIFLSGQGQGFFKADLLRKNPISQLFPADLS